MRRTTLQSCSTFRGRTWRVVSRDIPLGLNRSRLVKYYERRRKIGDRWNIVHKVEYEYEVG